MMMVRCLLLASLLSATVAAQNVGDAFTIIRLIRKPSGATAAPELIRAHREARVPVDVLGLRSITGTQQAWLVEAHGSFASIEATDKALTAAATASGDGSGDAQFATLIGLLRPGLSYRPMDAIKALAASRYYQVTIFRTRPGTAMEFAEVMRIRNAAQDQINLDRPEIGYQIISGTEAGTYVFLAPLPSLGAIDNVIASTWGRPDTAVHAARQATSKATAEAEIWREQLLFRVEPQMSYVSEAFSSAAPDFWLSR